MRFLFLVFFVVTLATVVLSDYHSHHQYDNQQGHSHTHHTHTHDRRPYDHSSSSSESKESLEGVCSGTHERIGCSTWEKHCGPAPHLTRCTKRCICVHGYARKGNDCIPEDHCESNKVRRSATDCSDPNEVYLYCGSKCPARCGDKSGTRTCGVECVRGCFCKKGLVLNGQNKCVSPDRC